MEVCIKTLRYFIFLFILCCLSHLILAAPCYGPTLPERNEFIAGGQTYVILRRYLEDNYGKVRSIQHFFQLSYGITDWLSLDLKGGAGNIKQYNLDRDGIDYSSSFAGGYGLRMRLYEKDNWRFVFGFQHISVHPRKTYIGSQENKAVLDDWQTSFLASYAVGNVRPYLGTKWSRLDYIHRLDGNRKRKMSDLDKMFGMVFGCDIPLAFGRGESEKIWLNVEGQAFDGEAFAASLNYKF